MRRAAIAFVGLVAALASCSSYGENVSEPGALDAGGSSSSGTTVGVDAATNDGGTVAESGTEAGVPLSRAPSVVQVASSATSSSSSSDQLLLTFDQGVARGHGILVFVAGWGTNVRSAQLGTLALEPLTNPFGQFPSQTVLLKLVANDERASRLLIQFDSPGAPAAIAVDLANVGAHRQTVSSGSGDVTFDTLATSPFDLVIANVAGSGTAPTGPLNAQPLGHPIDNNGQVLLAASASASAGTSPAIGWTSSGAFKWSGMMIAFEPLTTTP